MFKSELLEGEYYPLPAPEARGRGRWQRIEDYGRLWRERRFILRTTAAGLAASVLLAIAIPSRYNSQVQLMPPDQESGGEAMLAALSKAGSSMGNLGAELLGLKSSGDLFVGMLKSRTVADAVIRACDLRRVYSYRREEETRKRLASRTVIAQDRKSGIITIEVSDHSAVRAQQIAQAYVSELDRVVTKLNTSSANRERVFLEERLKTVKADLDSAQNAFSEFTSKNKALEYSAQGKALINAGAALAASLGAAQSEIEELRQIYADSNVRVRAAQARVNELRRQLQDMTGEQTSAGANSAVGPLPSIRDLPRLAATYYDLYRKVRVEEGLFEVLTKRYELAKVQEAKETPSVKVLDAAELPERSSFPPRGGIIIFGTLLSAIGAGAAVMMRARWQELPAEHPGRLLASEILHTAHSRFEAITRHLPAKARGRNIACSE